MQRPNENLSEYANISASLMGGSYYLKYWQFLFLAYPYFYFGRLAISTNYHRV